jgi:tRNA pseudouridine65 synthase
VTTQSVSSLDILYQDEALIIVNKPSGLLVHKSLIDKRERQFAMQILRDQIGKRVYPVHRLDKATSGALIFALSAEIAKLIGESFTQNRIEKRYLAVVRGIPTDLQTVDYALKEELDRTTDSRAQKNKPAQDAVTIVRRIAQCELPYRVDRYPTARYSLVEATPQTGRKHQVRRHLKHIRHPIIGDINYGVGAHNRFFEDHFGVRRLLLACTHLRMRHPVTKETLDIDAPLATDFKNLVNEILKPA